MADEMSKSAKRRAAKKARDAAALEEAAPAPTIANNKENKAGSNAKTAAPKAAAAPAAATTDSKAKAKASPKPKAEPKEEPKAAAKAKAKTAAKAPEPQVDVKKKDELSYTQLDDGTGGQWEVSTGLSKKREKAKDKKDEQQKTEAAAAKEAEKGGQAIPGRGGKKALGPSSAASAALIPDNLRAPTNALAAAEAAAAAAEAKAKAKANAKGEEESKVDPNLTTVSVTVPEKAIGIIIGPKGAKLNMIKKKTGVKAIDISGSIFTITGEKEAVEKTETAIRELADKGFTSLSYENFDENSVMVHPSSFPDLIGKRGAVIIAMKEELGVEVKIPQDIPKNPTADAKKKYKVTIAGEKENVEKAKEAINHILMYYHHEVTHPGEVHEEIDVPSWALSFVIGKAGSEMRHIQNSYKVRVYIPRETSMNQKVVIVGQEADVPRAKVYMEKLITNAEQGLKGREKKEEGDGDVWGEEGPQEPWMDQYMYRKRR